MDTLTRYANEEGVNCIQWPVIKTLAIMNQRGEVVPKKQQTDGAAFLQQIPKILESENVFPGKEETPVIHFQHPADLENLLKMDLDRDSEGTADEDLIEICKKVVKHSVKTSHPHFFNQLYGGIDKYSLAGAWITETLNTSQYTFEVSPVFTIAELAIIRKSSKLFGFPQNSDGIFCPGGSIANMTGMHLARYRLCPSVKSQGLFGLKPLVVYTSQDSHYSIQKGAHWMGLGVDNVVCVKTDEEGRMIPEELEKEISETLLSGKQPFFVNATVGTTVLGAFDPLDKIADICNTFGLWLHVDACWGGSLALSDNYKSILTGIERVDSLSWNPHKMLGVPQQCSLLLTRHEGLLHRCNSANANYLFQQDKFYDVSYDTGDKSLQCGRKVDAFKLWLMWKARGDLGLQKLVENAMQSSKNLTNIIRNREGFELVNKSPQCTNVCFWFVPPEFRNEYRDAEWWEKIHKVAPLIKEKMVKEGTMMIGYTPLVHKGYKNFFRIVFTCHPQVNNETLEFIVSQIEKYGNCIKF